jgi:hypothetical protein
MYQIMNKEMTACSISGYECLRYYERDKEAHLNPKDSRYGDVLVKMKRVKSGIQIKLKLKWMNIYWKPRFSWEYNKYFHWLFFMLWFGFTYSDVIDSVVSDHLSDFNKTVF